MKSAAAVVFTALAFCLSSVSLLAASSSVRRGAKAQRPQKPADIDKATKRFERQLRAALGAQEPEVVPVPRARRTIPTGYTLGSHRSCGHFGYFFSSAEGRKLNIIEHGGSYGLSDRLDLGYWLRDLQARGRDRQNKIDSNAWGVRVKFGLRKRARSSIAASLEFREANGVARRTAPTEQFRLDTRATTWTGALHWSRASSRTLALHALGLVGQTRDERFGAEMTTFGVGAGMDVRLGGRTHLEANAAFFHDEGDAPTGNEAMVSGFVVMEPTRGLHLALGAVLDVNGTPLTGLPLSDAAVLRLPFDKPIVRKYANDTVGYGVFQVSYRRAW